MLTNREEYIKKTFFNDLSDDDAYELVKKISKIGDSIGFIGTNLNQDQSKVEKRKHKYDVWISKEVKKNNDILNKLLEIRLIVDWAVDNNIDIFNYDFESAFIAQQQWHDEMMRKHHIEKLNIPNVDNDRVVFRFSDNEHFLYLLTPDDLKFEGSIMGHCVGGSNYKSKIKNKQSIILSIRDKNNMPHVTIEVDVKSRTVIQKYGKGNKPPVSKYLMMYSEYALFATNFKDLNNLEIIKFLNLDFNINNI